MLEKCCHDIDILNWLIGSKVEQVHSFASRSAFVSTNQTATNCANCDVRNECIYGDNKNIWVQNIPDKIYQCVYTNNSLYDHQVVNLKYNNEALVTFSYAWGQSVDRRTIYIMCSNGCLTADTESMNIRLDWHEKGVCKSQNIHIETDGTGHSGGDSVLVKNFFDIICNEDVEIRAEV